MVASTTDHYSYFLFYGMLSQPCNTYKPFFDLIYKRCTAGGTPFTWTGFPFFRPKNFHLFSPDIHPHSASSSPSSALTLVVENQHTHWLVVWKKATTCAHRYTACCMCVSVDERERG